MKFNKFLGLLAITAILFTSCADDDDMMNVISEEEEEEMMDFPYDEGLLISNEGPFNNGFGTISYVSADAGTVEHGIYQAVNNDNLGNVVHSIGFEGDLAYIISNVSNRLTVVNRKSFEEVARIDSGLNNPRFFSAVDGKGYVTNWGDPFDETDDFVAVINLSLNTIEATIPVALGPEEIIYNGTNLYIAHQGAFGTNNIVSVINPIDDSVSSTIMVGDVPSSMQLDSQGNLWVLAEGNPAFTMNETAGKLVRINTTTNAVDQSFDFTTTEHPNYLNIDNDNLYFYMNGGVYAANALDFLLPTTPQFTTSFYYNMNIINGKLYGCNAGDFASDGTVEVYDLGTNMLETTITAGIIPGNVYLNE